MAPRRRRSYCSVGSAIGPHGMHLRSAFAGYGVQHINPLNILARTAAAAALCATIATHAACPVHATAAIPPTVLPVPQIDAEHALVEETWGLVNRYFLDGDFHGVDWDSVHAKLSSTPLPSRRATYRALRSALSELKDPYTRLLSPQDMEALRKYDVSGVGLLLTAGGSNELVVATEPARGTPAAQAGVKQGDVLMTVDGVPVEGKGAFEVAELMQGEDGSDLQLQFRDRGKVTLTRHFDTGNKAPVEHELVADSEGRRIGYVRLNEFQAAGRNEVAKAVESLRNAGASAFVMDIRGNPGGVFQGALEIAGIFEGNNKPVARVSSRADTETYTSVVVGAGKAIESPLAIVVDDRSASAAEVLAGGLRDMCRAAIVGDSNSYGKGLIQGVFGLSDGGGLVVTVARYETPKGDQIQGKGLKPDLRLNSSGVDKLLQGIGIYRQPQIDFKEVERVTEHCTRI